MAVCDEKYLKNTTTVSLVSLNILKLTALAVQNHARKRRQIFQFVWLYIMSRKKYKFSCDSLISCTQCLKYISVATAFRNIVSIIGTKGPHTSLNLTRIPYELKVIPDTIAKVSLDSKLSTILMQLSLGKSILPNGTRMVEMLESYWEYFPVPNSIIVFIVLRYCSLQRL